MEAELFAATALAPCTGWPRTVMRGKLRKLTSEHNSVPKANRRPEPSSRNSRFAAHLRCVSAKEGLGSQEGTGNHWCPVPFCPCRRVAAFPPVNTGTPGRRRRPMTTPSEGVKSPPAAHRCIGGKVSPLLRGKKERGRRHAAYRQVCQPGGWFFLEKCCIFPCAVHTTYSIIK